MVAGDIPWFIVQGGTDEEEIYRAVIGSGTLGVVRGCPQVQKVERKGEACPDTFQGRCGWALLDGSANRHGLWLVAPRP